METTSFKYGAGDNGNTCVRGHNERISKTSQIFDCLGEMDLLRANICQLIALRDQLPNYGDNSVFIQLNSIIDMIFTYSAVISDFREEEFLTAQEFTYRHMGMSYWKIYDKNIDMLEKKCPKLTNFVIFDTNMFSAKADECRALARKCERYLLKYFDSVGEGEIIAPLGEECKKNIIKTFNRLSTLFFWISVHTSSVVYSKELHIWKPISK
jgi:cob(I)alamin adenosyltransferase